MGRILVTGASGQLDRKTLQHLLKRRPAGDLVGLARDPEQAADLAAQGIENLDAVRLSTSVHGEVLQDTTLDNLVFDFPAIIRYITTSAPLSPGDVIVAGTPGGVGVVAHPPRVLSPGDVTKVEVTGVGVLRNEIVEPEASG